MNVTKCFFPVFSIVLFLIGYPSFAQGESEATSETAPCELCKSWKLDLEATKALMTSGALQALDQIDSASNQMMMDDMATIQVTFDQDNLYTFEMGGQPFYGQWSQTEKTINIQMGADEPEEMTVNQLTEDRLVLQLHEESEEGPLFHYWSMKAVGTE